MHMAISSDDWLALNTQHCNRYHARMTPAVCTENQLKTDNYLCSGCSGLEDVQWELERREPVVIPCAPEADDPMTQALAGALQDILDGKEDEELPEDPEGDELDDELVEEELNGFHYKLLALMDCEPEEPEPERRPNLEHKRPRRVAVYMGRCPRCSGYVINDPEMQFADRDNEAYRCFSCGWRTSPAYEWNRQQ
ncbi:MAG: hypothetical protein JJE30_06060 [Desulfuromonadales bacterium]|nr:hypothetical protein [Desulfuromonadales bacterium]